MPTLPLYDPSPAHPDASHRVMAPGGYERWYFDAESTDGTIVVVAVFGQGTPDHPDYPEYVRRHAAFLRRPTRRPPPVPADHACVAFAAYEQGRPLVRHAAAVPGEAFRASPERLDIGTGSGEVVDAGGSLRLRAGGADFRLRPVIGAAPRKVNVIGRPSVELHHRRVFADSSYAVEGTIQVEGGRTRAFSGRGFHDHHFGTAPMRHWLRGRILGDDGAAVFSAYGAAREGPGRRVAAVEARWTQVDEGGVRDSAAVVQFEAARYPARIEIPGRTQLVRPQVLGAFGSVDLIRYVVSGPAPWDSGRHVALCEWCRV